MLTAERLRELLHYDPGTGAFVWRVNRHKCLAGKLAGRISQNGYLQIGVDYQKHNAHRLAWLYVTGSWPALDIDHVNGVRADNRWVNLREATVSQNQANSRLQQRSKSGRKGVVWRENRRKWIARIGKDKGSLYLGAFDSKEAAYAAYIAAANEHFGEFARA